MATAVYSSLQFSIADAENNKEGEGEQLLNSEESARERSDSERTENRKFGHGFAVTHTQSTSETMKGRTVRSWPPWAKRVSEGDAPPHVPLNSAEEDCNARGVIQGDVKNICERQDCAVTELRCPPDFEIVDLSNYTSANLTACRVDEVHSSSLTRAIGSTCSLTHTRPTAQKLSLSF